jgi:hypothetical protein
VFSTSLVTDGVYQWQNPGAWDGVYQWQNPGTHGTVRSAAADLASM